MLAADAVVVGRGITVLDLLLLLLLDVITDLVFWGGSGKLFTFSYESLFELFDLFVVCDDFTFNFWDYLYLLLVLRVDVLLAATDHRSVAICGGSWQFWS